MILEVSNTGEITLPAEMVQFPPHTRVLVERHGDTVVLKRGDDVDALKTAARESLTKLLEWAERNEVRAQIPPEALRRENFYD